MVNASNHTKCVLLSDQKYIIQPTRINLHPNEDNQEFTTIQLLILLIIHLIKYVFQIKKKI